MKGIKMSSHEIKVVFLLSLLAGSVQSFGNDTDVKYPSNLMMLKCGEVKPLGWIYEQINGDLTKGSIANYDKISDNMAQDIFVSGQGDYNQPVITKARINLPAPNWWAGEEGNWMEAVAKQAFLTDNKQYQDVVRDWIYRIIDQQEKDGGYIGVYNPKVRLNHKEENGELWTMHKVLRFMLVYYEYTGDPKVLESVRKAVELVMATYNKDNHYFLAGAGGGWTHGLQFENTLEWLYRITGDKKYADYAIYLYKEDWYPDTDISVNSLLKEGHKFKEHSAHTAEQFMVPFFIAAVTSDPLLKKATSNAIDMMRFHLMPSGSINCTEGIDEKQGTADCVKECCTSFELMVAFSRISMISGNIETSDWAATIAYNAAQAVRFHPYVTGHVYCSPDNQLEINPRGHGSRDCYSTAHNAVCCPPNINLLMPYFVEGMWLKRTDHPGLVAMQYGPCVLKTKIDNTNVTITEKTEYPFSDDVNFTIDTDKDIDFVLYLRRPSTSIIRIDPLKDAEI